MHACICIGNKYDNENEYYKILMFTHFTPKVSIERYIVTCYKYLKFNISSPLIIITYKTCTCKHKESLMHRQLCACMHNMCALANTSTHTRMHAHTHAHTWTIQKHKMQRLSPHLPRQAGILVSVPSR